VHASTAGVISARRALLLRLNLIVDDVGVGLGTGVLLLVGNGQGFGLGGLFGGHHHGCHLGAIFLTHLLDGLVMIISHEQFLHTRPLQQRLVLLHLFGVGVLPITVGVFSVKIVFFGRDVGRDELFLEKFFPGKAFEPQVVFEILRSILTEPVGRLT